MTETRGGVVRRSRKHCPAGAAMPLTCNRNGDVVFVQSREVKAVFPQASLYKEDGVGNSCGTGLPVFRSHALFTPCAGLSSSHVVAAAAAAADAAIDNSTSFSLTTVVLDIVGGTASVFWCLVSSLVEVVFCVLFGASTLDSLISAMLSVSCWRHRKCARTRPAAERVCRGVFFLGESETLPNC